MEMWKSGAEIYLACPDCLIHFNPASGTGEAVLFDDKVCQNVVIGSLLLLLRLKGLYGLRAAGLSKDGVGYLFVAKSGYGKSTCAYHLLQQGWHYLSDDALLLRESGGAIEAVAMRRNLRLKCEEVSLFEDRRHWREDLFSNVGKQHLDVLAAYPNQILDSLNPAVLLFSEIAFRCESQVLPLEKTEALGFLLQQSLMFMLDQTMVLPHLDVLKRLVRQARCYRLNAGYDVLHSPARFSKLLFALTSSTSKGTDLRCHPSSPFC